MTKNKGKCILLVKSEETIDGISEYFFNNDDIESAKDMLNSMISYMELKANAIINDLIANGYDHINLYLNSNSPFALVSIINECICNGMLLTVYHYDATNYYYVPQNIYASNRTV